MRQSEYSLPPKNSKTITNENKTKEDSFDDFLNKSANKLKMIIKECSDKKFKVNKLKEYGDRPYYFSPTLEQNTSKKSL